MPKDNRKHRYLTQASITTTASFRYIDPFSIDSSGSVKSCFKIDDGCRSYSYVQHQRSVENLKGQESNFGPDICGFDLYHHPAQEKEFLSEKQVMNGYYKEVEQLLRDRFAGVKKVVIFDHTISRNQKASPRQPVQQIHVDQTPCGAELRVRRHTPAPLIEQLLKSRYQIINVWRPIANPASDFPLVVVDWRTTRPEDFVPVDLLYPIRQEDDDGDDRGKEVAVNSKDDNSTEGYEVKGEQYGVLHNQNHEFFYVKDMTLEEVLFIKCFDSHSESVGGIKGLAGMTSRTAFIDPNTPSEAPERQSIEVRCLVFYE